MIDRVYPSTKPLTSSGQIAGISIVDERLVRERRCLVRALRHGVPSRGFGRGSTWRRPRRRDARARTAHDRIVPGKTAQSVRRPAVQQVSIDRGTLVEEPANTRRAGGQRARIA